jgi:transposase
MRHTNYDFSEEAAKSVFQLMHEAKDLDQYKRMQAIYFRACFKEKAHKISERTGLSIGTIWNIHNRWKRYGAHIFEVKNTGGRLRENLTLEEEKNLLKQFKKEGEDGGILEVKVIHEAYKKALGKNIALSTTYRMLDRHNWRKIMPRPRHPKGDLEAQAIFKKSGQRSLSKRNNKQKK